MARFSEAIMLEFEKQVLKEFTPQRLRLAVEVAAEAHNDVIRDRTIKGIDRHGKRLPRYTQSKRVKYTYRTKKGLLKQGTRRREGYEIQKKKIIKAGKYSGLFAAKRMPNHGRLSGSLFRSLNYRILQSLSNGKKIVATYVAFAPQSQLKKLEGLKSDKGAVMTRQGKKTYDKKPRDVYGLSTKDATRAKEIEVITAAFMAALNVKKTGFKLVKYSVK